MENKLEKLEEQLKEIIVNVPDFPVKGIMFRDIMPVLLKPELFQQCVEQMSEFVQQVKPTALIAPELRGCLFAAPIAYKLGIPFIVVRKKDKLPRAVYTTEYECEYCTNCLQIHQDSLKQNDRVVIIDDVLATSGTARAVEELVKQSNAQVAGYAFLIELVGLNGRKNLTPNLPTFSIVRY